MESTGGCNDRCGTMLEEGDEVQAMKCGDRDAHLDALLRFVRADFTKSVWRLRTNL